jgi:transcriptional regulator with XRE-family HTH domain
VVERRRAVALARHFREAEGLSIAQIAERLGRSPATVRAYFYDPSNATKGCYTSLGATRAVYGAPGAEGRPGPQLGRTHAAMAWRRQPDARSRPATERMARLEDGAAALRLRRWLEYRCSRNTT